MLSIQSDTAVINSLDGQTVESMIAVARTVEELAVEPLIILMKIQDGNWHRFFLDQGVLFWEEKEEVDPKDLEPMEGIDHLQLMPVPEKVFDIQFRQVGDNAILSMEFSDEKGWRLVQNKLSERCSMDFWHIDE